MRRGRSGKKRPRKSRREVFRETWQGNFYSCTCVWLMNKVQDKMIHRRGRSGKRRPRKSRREVVRETWEGNFYKSMYLEPWTLCMTQIQQHSLLWDKASLWLKTSRDEVLIELPDEHISVINRARMKLFTAHNISYQSSKNEIVHRIHCQTDIGTYISYKISKSEIVHRIHCQTDERWIYIIYQL